MKLVILSLLLSISCVDCTICENDICVEFINNVQPNIFGAQLEILFHVYSLVPRNRQVLLHFTAAIIDERGRAKKLLHKFTSNFLLHSMRKKVFHIFIQPNDYIEGENYVLPKIKANVFSSNANQVIFEEKIYGFMHLKLNVASNMNKVEVNKPFTINVNFKSTLKIPLTQCKINIESQSFRLNDFEVKDILPDILLSQMFVVTATHLGREYFLVKLNCKEIRNIIGGVMINTYRPEGTNAVKHLMPSGWKNFF